MNESLRLLKQAISNPFSASQASVAGVSRYALSKLCEAGDVEKISHGIYRLTEDDLSDDAVFRAATLRVGTPSAVCLVSALAHYGLTDLIPRKTWILVPADKRSRYADIRVVRSRKPNWGVGIEKRDGYAVTSVERSIVDALCLRSLVGSQLGLEALKRALKTNRTTLSKVMDISKKLQVSHRVLPYIEALA